ncbi:MAG: threonine synthase [Bacillota bacterium]|nr:threonine synthase [Bacillota bacterium]
MGILVSTRNNEIEIDYTSAILKGLSDDQGLFVPNSFNKIDFSDKKFLKMNYKELVYEILKNFIVEINEKDLRDIINLSYDNKFDNSEIVNVKDIDGKYIVELFHGPTAAFKDMALSILPNLLEYSKKLNNINEKTVILTATSGDTGKAALEGFKDIENLEIIVFYPENGVSVIQKKQMLTQVGKNTHIFGINGNFDDAQSAVKDILNDKKFKSLLKENNYSFSSANSINIGRLLPQIVYYVSSYFDLIKNKKIVYGDKIDVVVPTGNFGNILAGKYAKNIGLPIDKLICASNENNILTDFINTGIYDLNREFLKTISPSMDILISSNLERLLFHIADMNTNKVNKFMNDLKTNGYYKIDKKMLENLNDFEAFYCDEINTKKTIKNIFTNNDYLVDPHTAVALNVYDQYKNKYDSNNICLIMSTASPYKFPVNVAKSLNMNDEHDDFKLLKKIANYTNSEIPKNIADLENKKEIHNINININDMRENILNVLKI